MSEHSIHTTYTIAEKTSGQLAAHARQIAVGYRGVKIRVFAGLHVILKKPLQCNGLSAWSSIIYKSSINRNYWHDQEVQRRQKYFLGSLELLNSDGALFYFLDIQISRRIILQANRLMTRS
jgi:hypothetical protein